MAGRMNNSLNNCDSNDEQNTKDQCIVYSVFVSKLTISFDLSLLLGTCICNVALLGPGKG